MPVFYFEGVDGVGKTTTMKAVAEELVSRGLDLVLTKEPGGPKALAKEWGVMGLPYGRPYDGFRELCVNAPHIPQVVKRALYRADSLYNWELVVRPNLDKVILCDRSWISDLAYGSVLTEFNRESLFKFNEALAPDQIRYTNCVYLFCSEEVREARLRGNTEDCMDLLGADIRRKIERAYFGVFQSYLRPGQVAAVSTEQDLRDVVDEVVDYILETVERAR